MLLKTFCSFVLLLGFLQLTIAANIWCFKNSLDEYLAVPTDKATDLLKDTECYNSSCINLAYAFGLNGKTNGTGTNTSISAMLYLKKNSKDVCYNVFLLDWMKEASTNNNFGELITEVQYAAIVSRVTLVANNYGKAFQDMTKYGFDMNKTHLVGHSLGAHLVGDIGRYLKQFVIYVAKIIGLDPARPLFEGALHFRRLDESCAKYVSCVHTDEGGYGVNTSCGGYEFWPNNKYFITGTEAEHVQPGCKIGTFKLGTPDDYCSHDRSWMFLAETAINNQMLGIKAENYYVFAAGNGTTLCYFGYNADPCTDRGNYYFKTKASPLYGKGLDGIS